MLISTRDVATNILLPCLVSYNAISGARKSSACDNMNGPARAPGHLRHDVAICRDLERELVRFLNNQAFGAAELRKRQTPREKVRLWRSETYTN